MSEEKNLFIVDDQPDEEDNSEVNESPIPLFSSSKFILGLKDGDDEGSSKISEDEEDYYGLPPPSIRIEDALAKCPIQATFFKPKTQNESLKSGKFKDKLLCSLDDYLNELRIKTKHTFITDGIETKRDISKLGMSDSQLKKSNRKEREKTKGANWFNMKAPEMTDELKNELQVIQLRSALDPKHFYKRSEMKSLPKYFEMGKVIESPVEYHSTKNDRKRNRTLVDELLQNEEFQQYNKKKYQEATVETSKKGYQKAMKKMNKLKKR